MNAYKPWELEGISEEQFWRRKYIEVELENGQLRAVVEAAQEFISSDYYCENRHAHRAVALEAALAKLEGK